MNNKDKAEEQPAMMKIALWSNKLFQIIYLTLTKEINADKRHHQNRNHCIAANAKKKEEEEEKKKEKKKKTDTAIAKLMG